VTPQEHAWLRDEHFRDGEYQKFEESLIDLVGTASKLRITRMDEHLNSFLKNLMTNKISRYQILH
jgi:hypothetical protein